jgi:hypothetical protein
MLLLLKARHRAKILNLAYLPGMTFADLFRTLGQQLAKALPRN